MCSCVWFDITAACAFAGVCAIASRFASAGGLCLLAVVRLYIIVC